MLFAMLSPTTTWADPIKMDWPSIPDGYGMDYFYGQWIGNQQQAGTFTFTADGVMSVYAQDDIGPITPYIVLIEKKKYILIVTKTVSAIGFSYMFRYIHPNKQGSLTIAYCSRYSKLAEEHWGRLREEDFLKGKDYLLNIWNTGTNCNPALGRNKATEDRPWGEGWNQNTFWRDTPFKPVIPFDQQ